MQRSWVRLTQRLKQVLSQESTVEISRDFSDSTDSTNYPQHGWAKNSQGIPLLWLPIISILQRVNEAREYSGVGALLRGGLEESSRFLEKLERLALCLHEIHRLDRGVRITGIEPVQSQTEIESRRSELIPLYLEMAYITLHRVADDFARAARLVLFADVGSAPGQGDKPFRTLRDFVLDERKLSKATPLCDVEALRDALSQQTGWFDVLTRENRSGRKGGLCDTMEHRPFRYAVSRNYADNESEGFHVTMVSRAKEVDTNVELVETLRATVEGICKFWTVFASSLVWAKAYEKRDVLMLSGATEDTVGFWPEL